MLFSRIILKYNRIFSYSKKKFSYLKKKKSRTGIDWLLNANANDLSAFRKMNKTLNNNFSIKVFSVLSLLLCWKIRTSFPSWILGYRNPSHEFSSRIYDLRGQYFMCNLLVGNFCLKANLQQQAVTEGLAQKSSWTLKFPPFLPPNPLPIPCWNSQHFLK